MTTAPPRPRNHHHGDGSGSAALVSSPYLRSLLAGGFAGTAVDLSLFPLDTLKTRLQSSGGFFANGGWHGIYKGVGSVLAGSAPGAALFFVSYEGVKSYFASTRPSSPTTTAAAAEHMLAASLGEIAACSVRVPTEVIKQRAQAGQFASSRAALAHVLGANRGAARIWRELYRGWSVTVAREIPFTAVQFPLWEAMKSWRARQKEKKEGGGRVNAVESAVFGSVAGAVAAAVTTPLDVLKTRLMLARKKQSALSTFRNIVADEGAGALFKGIGPRVLWISIGGAIFLGAWDFAKGVLEGGRRAESRS